MNKTFDVTKPVRTRDGHPARIICTDRAAMSKASVIALVTVGESELLYCYNSEGRAAGSLKECPKDLVNIPETVERFINIYPAVAGKVVATGGSYISVDSANRGAGPRRNGLMKITFEDDVPVKMEYEAV